jgi:arsenite/tail-anchored protein-transporting ATPase
MAEELAVIPGMEEVVSLLQIRREAREGNFDVVIVDAAPTGETVRLLTMPETFKLYAERLVNSTSMKLMRPFIRTFSPSTDVMDGLDKLTREVEELRTTLTDPDISSYRVVLTPERMVLKEAQRAATYLALYGYPVDGVVLNRVLPDEVAGDSFLGQLAAVQRGYREEAYNTFKPLPIWEAPYEPRDLAGLEDLSRLGLALFGDDDPTRVFFRGATQQLEKDGDGYILTMPLPHVELDKVKMTKRGDQLFVEIGNFRREVILPLMLSNREATGAVFRRDGTLEIKFGPAPVPVIQPAAAT